MHFRKKRIALILLVVLITPLICSCTVIGTLYGLHKDAVNARANRHRSWEYPDSIPLACKVQVMLTDGNLISGKYKGLFELSDADYELEYAQAKTALASSVTLPSLGDTISIAGATTERNAGCLAGFGEFSLLLKGSNSVGMRRLALADINEATDFQGKPYNTEALKELMEARQLPIRRALQVRADGVTTAFPLQRVQQVYTVPRRTHYWLLGAGIGLAVDWLVWQKSGR
jgi:hypothetical protein